MSERRYPFAALATAMGVSENQAGRLLKLSGEARAKYRRHGMTEEVADRMAVKAGMHPFEVWPEMADDWLAEVECAADDCTERFPFSPYNRRFCSRRCRTRVHARLRRQRPEVKAVDRLYTARYYAEAGEYVRARERRRYWADPVAARERKRRARAA